MLFFYTKILTGIRCGLFPLFAARVRKGNQMFGVSFLFLCVLISMFTFEKYIVIGSSVILTMTIIADTSKRPMRTMRNFIVLAGIVIILGATSLLFIPGFTNCPKAGIVFLIWGFTIPIMFIMALVFHIMNIFESKNDLKN